MQSETWYALATLTAIVLGPLIAVILTRFMDERAAKRARRFEVFSRLMQTRGLRLDPIHVTSLNIIEIEFYRDAAVRRAYRAYIGHLSAPMPAVEEQTRFFEQRHDLFIDMMAELAKAVGYHFDKLDLQRLSYAPEGWNSDQVLQRRNAEMLGQILEGRRPLPISNIMGNASPFPEPPRLSGPEGKP